MTALVAGVISTGLTAVAFEALTDRDWALRGWEWPKVLAAALVVTLGSFWVLSLLVSTGPLATRRAVHALLPLPIRRPVGISLFRARARFNLARRQALSRLPFLAARELVYDDWYYDKIDRGAPELYNRLADTLLHVRSPASVVDVGCGTGIMLKPFADAGVAVQGIEGSRSAIRRSPVGDRIVRANLERGVPDLGRFDVCLCIEVAEHLSPRSASPLVAGLVRLSDLVVFTASQGGGMGHLTIQPKSYWCKLFALHGFGESPLTATLLDAIADIPEPWYIHKNLTVFEKMTQADIS